MKALKVTRREEKAARKIESEWELLLLLAESVNFKLLEPEYKKEVVEFINVKNEFRNFLILKYNLDPQLQYRINENRYLEVERGEKRWLLWEILLCTEQNG